MRNIREEVQEIFRSQFHDPSLEIGPETTARDIEEWDSLNHVTLILAIETHFGVRFRLHEVAELQSVGQLFDLIASHLKQGE